MRKRKDGTFEGTENGTILHFVLEKFFGDVRDGKINDKQDAAQKASEYFDLAIKENHFEVLLEKADTGRILARLKQEGITLCQDLFDVQKRSKFTPYLLEAKIGESEIKPMSLEFDGKNVELKGTIDRVTCSATSLSSSITRHIRARIYPLKSFIADKRFSFTCI